MNCELSNCRPTGALSRLTPQHAPESLPAATGTRGDIHTETQAKNQKPGSQRADISTIRRSSQVFNREVAGGYNLTGTIPLAQTFIDFTGYVSFEFPETRIHVVH